MTQTKTVAMLLIAIAVIGTVGIGTGIAHATALHCPPVCPLNDPDDTGHGQSFHDGTRDVNSHAFSP